MAEKVQFVREGAVYFAQTAGVAGPDRRAAFLPATGQSNPPATISLGATWGAGIYVFLGEELANAADFAPAFRALIDTPSFRAARFVWIANPNDRRDLWRLSLLRGDSATGALNIFDFGTFGFGVEPGCPMSVDTDESGFLITERAGPGGGLFFTARNGALRLPATGPLGISLTAGKGGRLRFSMTPGAGAAEALDIGIRLFFPASRLLGASLLASVSYPVFDDSGAAHLTLDATLDPLFPADASRTSIALDGTSVAIPSFYRTSVGKTVMLKPRPGSRLLFAPRNILETAGACDPLYLTPDGPFAVVGQDTLLCGIFGSEFIEADDAMTVTLVAGQPAFAGAFDPGNIDAPMAGVLSSAATTAWAVVSSASQRVRYSAVPQDAGYYESPTGSTLFSYYPACAAFLPAAVEGGDVKPYPLLPYAALDVSMLDIGRALEVHLLSRIRRDVARQVNRGQPLPPIRAVTVANQAPAPVRTLTPQGLIAEFSADRASWPLLKIAQSEAGPLAFHAIGEPLRSALLTKQQFIVISDPQAVADLFNTDNTAALGGWNFQLAPESWSRFGTVLIVKNDDKSLASMVEDTGKWTLAGSFNHDVAATQQQLRAAIAAARAALADNADFGYFVSTVVDSADWNGFLFLNCPLSASQLPPDLEGLAPGLDQNAFFAHHLGINQTPVPEAPPGADFDMLHSSLFGLIDYRDPSTQGPSQDDYDFRVKKLRVLFYNSAVTNFSCQVALTINKLFGARVKIPGAAVILDGQYESHGEGNALSLHASQDSTFELNDKVLKSVVITDTHLSTRLPAAGTDTASRNVEARFTFWGSLAFQELTQRDATDPSFDLFSYGRVSFSNLAVAMNFNESDPGARRFAFDASEMAVETVTGGDRASSLARHFPLKLKSFILSKETEKPPAQLGYATVGMPLERDKLSQPWYGLLLDLNLGTLGELASNAGINASLALLWSPDANLTRVFAGLKLPGLTGGGNSFSLLGVLKMKMYSLDLVRTGGAFQLLFNGISLTFFGKSIPPGASFDVFLFGDPGANAVSNSLGWYGGFKKAT